MTSAEGSRGHSWETGHEKGKPTKSCFSKEFICATEVKVKTKPYTVGKEYNGGTQPHEEGQQRNLGVP